MNFNLLATPVWRRQAGGETAPPAHRWEQTVFIVDDDAENLRAMSLALAGEAYRVETARSADAAIPAIWAAEPALILSNLRLVTADGTPLFRKLVADGRLVAVPIVALTEMGSGIEWNEAAANRFDARIRMPINPQTFPGKVRSVLDSLAEALSRRTTDRLLADAPADDLWGQLVKLLEAIEAGLPESQFCADTQPSLRRLAEEIEGLRHPGLADFLRQAAGASDAATARGRSRFRSLIQHCRELVEQEPDVTPGLAELCAGYLERRCAELSNLELALSKGDFAALGKAGHNMKGTGAAYGFGELTRIGAALDTAAKGSDARAVGELLAQLDWYLGMVHRSPA